MNLLFLGDALDYWKGALLADLRDARLLNGSFAVDPMATDLAHWTPPDYELFAQLLRIGPHQILRHRYSLATDRIAYFRDLPHAGDLFLDPDTGVATGRVPNLAQYVRPQEIGELISQDGSCILA